MEADAPILAILFMVAFLCFTALSAAWLCIKTPEGIRVYWGFELMPWLIPVAIISAGLALLFFFINARVSGKERRR